jgi:hypothetical protein
MTTDSVLYRQQSRSAAITHPFRRDEWQWRIVIVVISSVLGSAYALSVAGPRVLNPLNLSWLTADPATAYLGWAFFRQEPHLTLPLGWSASIGYPLGEPIAYLDSIPLVATLFWLIRGILPENFQYLGLYFAVCSALQYFFGYRISRRLCAGSRIAGVLGGCLFLMSAAFTWRALGHFALASHWIILAALDQLLVSTARPSRAQIAGRGVLCLVAGGINPYITFMTLLVLAGAYLRALLAQRQSLLRCGAGLGLAVAAAIAGLLLFGFIGGADVSQYTGGGYEAYSMNLLAPIDPQQFTSLLLRQQPENSGQYEGYNYLGLGLIAIGLFAISRRPSSLRLLWSVETAPAVGIFVISLLLALSLLGTAGNVRLWHFRVSGPLMSALQAFRCSGRLFWPGYYLLFIGIIAAAHRAFPGWRLNLALSLALEIQVLDLATLRNTIHEQWQTASADLVSQSPDWHGLGRMQRHMVVIPAWQCETFGYGYATFGRLAVEQHMTTNSFYAGRYSDAQKAFFCEKQPLQIISAGLQSDTAYIFDSAKPGDAAAVPDIVVIPNGGKYCRRVDATILCSQVAGRSGIDPSLLNQLPVLHSGDVIAFSGANATAGMMLGSGWWQVEPWGRWARGEQAVMAFRVPAPARRDVQIDISVQALLTPSHPLERVDTRVNGESLPQQSFTGFGGSIFHLRIPARLIGEDGLARIVLRFPDAASPSALGMSVDARVLSIGIKELRVLDAGN